MRPSLYPHRILWLVEILGIEKSSPTPLVSNMVILRNYLPEGRELEEDMGRKSGIRYEGTGNRE